MDTEAVSVLETFRAGRESSPDRPLYTIVDDAGQDARHLTVGAAHDATAAVAGFLHHACGLRPGDRAILAYTPSMEFVTAFIGCLRAGVIPVPVPPPHPGRGSDPGLQGLAAMCAISGARAILANREYLRWRRVGGALGALRGARSRWPRLPWHATDDASVGGHAAPPLPTPSPSDVAYLQFTSGTAGDPKAVPITYGNLQHQLTANAVPLQLEAGARAVLWVPHFHDLCLISGILNALAGNGHLYLISPLTFVRRPAVWFDVMSRVGATHTAAPNLAFELAVRRTTPAQRERWDLRSLRVLMTAAEPIRPSTVRAFYEAFRGTGLREDSFCPAYGLAEHSVGVTVRGRSTLCLDRAALERRGVAEPLSDPASGADAVVLFGCGPALSGTTVRIVDPETHAVLADGQEGEIWVDSPSKASGYVGAAAASNRALFEAVLKESDGRTYLRTGDLGVLWKGELFFTARRADVIRLAGRNLYPQDLEETVREAHPLIRPGCVVACATSETGVPGLAILAEVRTTRLVGARAEEVVAAIRRRVLDAHRMACAVVWLARPGSIPKTTSGKLMRARCRERLRDGTAQLPGTLHLATTSASRLASTPRHRVNVLRNLGTAR
jgi:acyl-CoA synthetase (AMP-forming)/AMP-acid ligase II